MAGGIFISYRRSDSQHAAGRLVDRLRQVYPTEQLFMDVDSIDLGLDFVKVLDERVSACDVMLVVMGPAWRQAVDEHGRRRLDDPNDFVRLEVEAALSRDIRVIPVLVDGAQTPPIEELPSSLSSLVRRQATRITHERFGGDADRLIASLVRIVGPARATPAPQPVAPPTTPAAVAPRPAEIARKAAAAAEMPRMAAPTVDKTGKPLKSTRWPLVLVGLSGVCIAVLVSTAKPGTKVIGSIEGSDIFLALVIAAMLAASVAIYRALRQRSSRSRPRG